MSYSSPFHAKATDMQYIVFMDYLTKWSEVFAFPDQTALTIARLLMEQVISRHGVPSQLLLDYGPPFLSKLQELCAVMETKKVNTTAYHPQTDGLVEQFNHTLTDMLAKTINKGGQDWIPTHPVSISLQHANFHHGIALPLALWT